MFYDIRFLTEKNNISTYNSTCKESRSPFLYCQSEPVSKLFKAIERFTGQVADLELGQGDFKNFHPVTKMLPSLYELLPLWTSLSSLPM